MDRVACLSSIPSSLFTPSPLETEIPCMLNVNASLILTQNKIKKSKLKPSFLKYIPFTLG
jgi:hypothetical protein